MILVDTSVWVDHLRRPDPGLVERLEAAGVLTHPWVIGEIALGTMKKRSAVLDSLVELPRAVQASDDEILSFIGQRGLAGFGVGYIDAGLLASVLLTPDSSLWTRDRRLSQLAERVSVPLYSPNSAPRAE